MHSDRSHLLVGLPHSEIRGSQPSYRLLSAYRRFSRPSSPLNAKASIMCPFSLGHAYLTPSGGRCMPRPDFADPELRPRVVHRTRVGDSNISRIVLGFQSLRHQSPLPDKPGPFGLGLRRQARLMRSTNTSLVKDAQPLARLGIGNGTEVGHAVKGLKRLRCRNFC